MKTFKLIITTVLCFCALAECDAQIAYPVDSASMNPLEYPKEIAANREIALIWDEKDGSNDYKMRHKFFDVNQLNINDLNSAIALQSNYPTYTGSPDNNGNRHIGSCSGDFNGDEVEDYLCGTEGTGYEVVLRSYSAQVLGNSMTVNLAGTGLNFGHLNMTDATAGFIRLASGNFDAAPDDEAVLLYREDLSDVLQITIYDFDAGLNLVQVGQIADESMSTVSGFESFDLQVVDLDYDGTCEIIIAGSQFNSGNYKPFVKVYDVTMNGSATITPREKTFVPTNITSSTRMTIALTTGDFNNDFVEEIALAFGIQITDNNGSTPDTWLRLFRVGDDTLNTPGTPDWLEKTVLLPQFYETVESVNSLANLDLDAGDVDGDGYEDIVLGTGSEMQLFKISNDFDITYTDPLGGSYSNNVDLYYDQFITVGDMNNDGKAEVLNVRNWVDEDDNLQYISITVHLWNPQSLQWQELVENNTLHAFTYSGAGNLRQFSVVIGDFDGDNLYFGDYNYFTYTDIVQPIIILNAPPTHSDNIGTDEWTDVNGIWEDADCSDFTSHYSETTTESFTVETSISNAWSVSAAIGAEFDGLVVSASASFEASYGENYTNTNGNTSTTTEVSVTTTCFDDAVYASIVTYDVYEYPLYVGDTLICYVVSIHPRMDEIQYQWISTKSDQGQFFVTQHEPGNLLSYRPFNSPQFELDDTSVFSGGNNINLSTTISNAWEVTTEEVQESSADTERSIGMEASASVGAFGISATVTGSYDWTGISTHSSSVGEAIAVGLDVGTLPIESSNATYAIKPYIFWGEGNEVVLDYEVNANGNFFEEHYNVQDPAWNLPWRLDDERGYTLDAQTKIRQSKSLWFDKKFPQAGDTITATARVFNYSLIATESPVEVKFFFGNPLNGGVAVTGMGGEEVVETAGPIASQQYKDVSLTIVLPEDFPYDGRLYAQIDPDSTMTEVHEENNLCWRWLGPYFPISDDDYEEVIPDGLNELISESGEMLVYPNPANEFVEVMCAVNNSSPVEIQILNMEGQMIYTQTIQNTSSQMLRERISLESLVPGVYAIHVSDGKNFRLRKLVKES